MHPITLQIFKCPHYTANLQNAPHYTANLQNALHYTANLQNAPYYSANSNYAHPQSDDTRTSNSVKPVWQASTLIISLIG